MDRAHLIPKARIKRELRIEREWRPVVWDPRVLVKACRRHHADWDNRVFNIARGEVPQACEEYAEEYGLVWSLDRDYGERRAA
jgi:hypothetical protein